MDDIKEIDYKPDFELADRYISFSSEILRLSLLAITAISSLMIFAFEKETAILTTMQNNKCLFIALNNATDN